MLKSRKKSKTNEELAKEAQKGDAETIEALWMQVQNLVKWKANRVLTVLEQQGRLRGLEFEDLLHTGYIAMLEAVQTFNPAQGSFSTWLNYYLQSAFANISGYKNGKYRDPIHSAVSLDLPLSEDPDGGVMYETIPDPKAAEDLEAVEDAIWQQQLHNTLEEILAEIPEVSTKVLRLRFYQNQTLTEVGSAFSVGTEMARQMERQALRELRKPKRSRKLSPFLDFNVYSGTGLTTFRATGTSIQERYLIREEKKRTKKEADRQF